jgi:AcrR family transcriptional regulator
MTMTVSTSPTALAPAPSDRRKPGRPRSEQADQAIVAATLELLAEGTTVGELSIETVAQRAGVGKATIYRRWHNKEALLIDSLKALHAPLPECASCGTARDDLIELMTALAQATDESLAGRIFPCMMAEKMRSPELAWCCAAAWPAASCAPTSTWTWPSTA